MQYTDSLVMAGPYAHLSTPVLRFLVERAEKAQVGADLVAVSADESHLVGFSTALTDKEREYLDLCAELFARGEYAAGRQPCDGSEARAV